MLLGIESSCDDTSVALCSKHFPHVNICLTQNQAKYHLQYGGVVPEIASREHLHHLPALVQEALQSQGIQFSDLQAIAVTCRPGLIGSLIIGTSYAQALGFSLNLPVFGIDHLEAHIFSVFINQREPVFPFLSLVVSGGHTHLYLVEGLQQYSLLGRTLDDALGEAFDKVAKMLGLQYPGGPEIEKLAGLPTKRNFVFPMPLKGQPNLNFSFSGLKTFARNLILAWGGQINPVKHPVSWEVFLTQSSATEVENSIALAKAFQEVSINFLMDRLQKAVRMTKVKKIGICGGVAQNAFFQQRLAELAQKNSWHLFTPLRPYTADNAAMVAYLGHLYAQQNLAPAPFKAQAISPLAR